MNGKELRARRQKAGLTQAQLANRTGRSQANISQAESGRVDVPDDVAKAIGKLKADPAKSKKLLAKGGAAPRKKRAKEKKPRGKVVRTKPAKTAKRVKKAA